MADPMTRKSFLSSWTQLRRPRLTFGVLVGLLAYALLIWFSDVNARLRFIEAWDIGATAALIALFFGLRKSSALTIKQVADRQDAGKWAVLSLTLLAATASLIVIASEMPLVRNAQGVEQAVRAVLVIYTIVLSWAFIQTMFALHYAHDYYMAVELPATQDAAGAQRLVFPGERTPTYGDFLYFSFTIGMCAQVSDVPVTSKRIRRTVFGHSAISFIFNAALLALTVNIAASSI